MRRRTQKFFNEVLLSVNQKITHCQSMKIHLQIYTIVLARLLVE